MARTKVSKKSMEPKVPRPMNCFLAFRLEKQGQIVDMLPGANHRDISKLLAKLWKELPESEKEPYRERARQAKIEHAQKYPEYKYQPQKRNGRKTRKYVRRPQDKFTSRYEENNRIMEMFYENPQRFFSSSSSPDNVQQGFASIVKSGQKQQQGVDTTSPVEHFVTLPDPKVSSPESYSSSSCSSDMGSPLQTPPFSTASSATENMLFDKNTFFFGNNYGCSLGHSEEFMMPTTTPASMTVHATEQHQLYYDNSIFPLPDFSQQQQQQHSLLANSPINSVDSNNAFLFDQFTSSPIESCSEWTLSHPAELPAEPLCVEQQQQQQQIYNNVPNVNYFPIDSIDPSLLNIENINNSTQYGFYH